MTDDATGKGGEEVDIVRSNLRDSYWSPFQMVAYQSSCGWGINIGDLLGIGTISSPV
jgi:fumarylacetoacetase